VPPHALSQIERLLGGEFLRKIHDDLGFDRACQRVGMSLWWTTLVLGFGALFGNLVAHLL
jgi:hypothetical protein